MSYLLNRNVFIIFVEHVLNFLAIVRMCSFIIMKKLITLLCLLVIPFTFYGQSTSTCFKYLSPNVPDSGILNDNSSIVAALPFTFCFYGVSYTSLWINDNGTVSFDQPHGSFTTQTFPFTTAGATAEKIIAPFWADFNQAGSLSGRIHYEILADAIIVHWAGVGYHNAQDDKLNTMMLVLTDGTSPLLQSGTNVGFFYEDMQWTTGDSFGGIGGFGGDPATVGVNNGNGVDYLQIGRFDGPGTGYDGPLNFNDSVSWLDNKTFMFNICNSNNIPPIVTGIDLCDTLRLCVGDTLPFNASFLAPETSQTTWVEVDTSQANGFQITNLVSGTNSNAQVDAAFIASPTNVGINIISFKAYDNGVPPDTVQFEYIVIVDSLPFLPEITGDSTYCEGDTVSLDAGAGFDSYLWNNAETTQAIDIMQGKYAVTASFGGCSATTDTFTLAELSIPVVAIIGDSIYCPGDSALLNATIGYNSYLWNTSINNTLDSVTVAQGVFSVTVTDTNGCEGISNTITVYSFDEIGGITGDTTYCLGDSVLLDAGAGFDSYLWNNGDTTQTSYVTQGSHSVDVSLFVCLATHYQNVSLAAISTPIITGDSSFCIGDSVQLNAARTDGSGYDSYSWSLGDTTQTIFVTQGVFTVIVTDTNGCAAISQPFTVGIDSLPNPVIIGSLQYCSNDSNGTTLSSTNNYPQYFWSNATTGATTTAAAGSITLTVIDTNNCIGTSPSVNVISSAPNDSITGVIDFCLGTPINISATPGFTSYLWNTGDTTNNITAGSGGYSVIVHDAFGCTDFDTITLIAETNPIAYFSISPIGNSQPFQPVTFKDSSTITSGTIDSWSWDFDITNIGRATPMFASGQGPHIIEYSLQGKYTISLIITSNKNCADTITYDYLIFEDIKSPNVITPNGDGMNDFLVFENLEFHPNNTLVIFNRWGNLLFEQEEYQNNWDGEKQSEGTYFYILTLEGIDTPIKGSFTILY